MAHLLIIGEYTDSVAASMKAKELAIRFKECTSVKPSANGWVVLASQGVKEVLEEEEKEGDYGLGEEMRDWEMERELAREIEREGSDILEAIEREEEEEGDDYYYDDEMGYISSRERLLEQWVQTMGG